ncbi:MAG: NAD-dependent epimerase/dehydratase family protein [Acidaminococcaceae bacterium]|nr:NAD-dependent epimerase/dehydratase family protein [Acidaminococcaceae bacterium]
MWTENQIFLDDLDSVSQCGFLDWEKFRNKSFFVTGATGLIGYTVCSALLYADRKRGLGLHVTALARDATAARCKYRGQIADGCPLSFVIGNTESLPPVDVPVDFIVHCAAPTASRYFVSNPVETIRDIVHGTEEVLKLAKERRAEKVVYLSSMEVYGQVLNRSALDETMLGYLDPIPVRSSYPEAKRLAEALCSAYAAEYGVPAVAARLAQTFGPGVRRDDGRVFAYMARCALDGQDIRLDTDGTKENMYLYTMDASSAILALLSRGEAGKAYNVANPKTFCSVKRLGEIASGALSGGKSTVLTGCGGPENNFFRPEGSLALDVSKLSALGWSPKKGLPEMFRAMAACF